MRESITSETPELANLEAERNVLGACLLHVDAASEVCAVLQPEDFFLARHQIIFRALRAAYARGHTDPIVVGEALARSRRLEEAGGHAQLLDLAETVVTAVGVEYHAEIILEYSRRRRIRDLARHMLLRVQDGEPAASLVAACERQLLEIGLGAPASQARMRSWLDVATDSPVAWSIDGLEPSGGNLLIAGEPGNGKTLLAIDKSLRKAHGMDWFGRASRAGSTLYLVGEGLSGFGARLRAWRAAHPKAQLVDGHYVEFFDGVPDLTKATAVGDLHDLIVTAERRHGRKPDDVIVDTLAMAMPGADENDAGPIGAVMAVLAETRRRHGCSTTTLHHLRKPTKERPNKGPHAVRGSSAIVAAVDVAIIAGMDGGSLAISVVKSRDGELLAPFPYAIRGQETGLRRDDGRPEVAPIVLPTSAPEKREVARDLDAEADADLQRVVAKLAQMGSAPSANRVVRRIPGNRQNLLAAFREAVEVGLVLNAGTSRNKKFVVAGSTGSGGVCAASPQTPGGSGTGNQPMAGPDSDLVPASGGNHLEPPGTSQGVKARRSTRKRRGGQS